MVGTGHYIQKYMRLWIRSAALARHQNRIQRLYRSLSGTCIRTECTLNSLVWWGHWFCSADMRSYRLWCFSVATHMPVECPTQLPGCSGWISWRLYSAMSYKLYFLFGCRRRCSSNAGGAFCFNSSQPASVIPVQALLWKLWVLSVLLSAWALLDHITSRSCRQPFWSNEVCKTHPTEGWTLSQLCCMGRRGWELTDLAPCL